MPGKTDVSRVMAAESFKLVHQRTSALLLLLLMLTAVVLFFGLEIAARRDWIGVPGGYFLAASAIGWVGNIVVLIAVVKTSFIVSQEFALGTIKSTWTRPIHRRAWYKGKVLTACAVVTLLFLLAVAAVVLLALFRSGFSDLMEKDYLVHTAQSMGMRLALTVALMLWSIWAATVVVVMLSCLVSYPGGAVACSFWLGVAMIVLSMFPEARPFLLSTYIGLPADQMVAMSKGLPLPMTWNEVVWKTLLVPGLWMLAAYLVGRRIVDKKEISS